MELAGLPLFRALSDRASGGCQLSMALAGALIGASRDVSPLLEYIKQSFPAYPSHGIDHATRVIMRIGQILKPQALDSLNSVELFCLLYSALLHDVGMVAPDSLVPNDPSVRDRHHVRSARFAAKHLQRCIPAHYNPRLSSIVSYVIESHGVDWDTMASNALFVKNETIGQYTIRPRILAVLLRLGDLLDLDFDRTNTLCLGFYREWIARNASLPHHERHRMLTHFECTPERIEISARCSSMDHYRIWSQWINYLLRDIERANTYVFRDQLSIFQLPIPHHELQGTQKARFKVWKLRFEIDDHGQLWDVLRQSVYTGRYDYVRELTSNAIDACIRLMFDSSSTLMPNKSPRCWTLADYHPHVFVISDMKRRLLMVYDNGIGMTLEDMQIFLFRVASRGTSRHEGTRGFALPTIGYFGIGFISILTRASVVRVLTKRVDERGVGHVVDCDANLRDATVEPIRMAEHGTRVALQLRDDECREGRELVSYMKNTFVYPAVPVSVIDCDKIRSLEAYLKAHGLFTQSLAIGKIVDHLRSGRWQGSAVVDRVRGYVNGAAEAIRAENQRRKQLDHEHMLERLERLKREEEEVPQLRTTTSPSSERRSVRGRTTPAAYPERLPSLSESATEGCIAVISNANLPEGSTALGYVILLDYDGQPRKVRRLGASVRRVPLDAGASLAVLVVPISIDDLDRGVEWRSLHSFLVVGGKVVRHAAFKFTLGGGEVDDMVDGDDLVIGFDEVSGPGELFDELQEKLCEGGMSLGDFVEMYKLKDVDVEHRQLTVKQDDILFEELAGR